MAVSKAATKRTNLDDTASMAPRRRSSQVVVRKSNAVETNRMVVESSRVTYIPDSDAGIRFLDALERVALQLESSHIRESA